MNLESARFGLFPRLQARLRVDGETQAPQVLGVAEGLLGQMVVALPEQLVPPLAQRRPQSKPPVFATTALASHAKIALEDAGALVSVPGPKWHAQGAVLPQQIVQP